MNDKTLQGHLVAAFTVVVWGVTFISTKILLTGLGPFEILVLRFALGYAALWLACPRCLPWQGLSGELPFALAGLSGICLYFLMENFALVVTQASNVGIIVSLAPFFTVLFSKLTRTGGEPLHWNYFAGLALSMTGMVCIGYNGLALGQEPLGDVLALGAAAVWGCYSVVTRNIVRGGLNIIVATRRIFFYGLVSMAPAMYVLGFAPDMALLASPLYLGNLLFLGLVASALCYVTWNRAVALLGALKTSAYIYAIPVIAVVTAFVVLDEPVTLLSGTGATLALTGLVIAERKPATAAARHPAGPENPEP